MRTESFIIQILKSGYVLMKDKLKQHAYSLLFVLLIFMVLFFVFSNPAAPEAANDETGQEQVLADSLNLNDPLNSALVRETIDYFFGADKDSVLQNLENARLKPVELIIGHNAPVNLGWRQFFEISGMWFDFVFIYVIVLLISYYSVQTLATWRFVQFKQDRAPYTLQLYWTLLKLIQKEPVPRKIHHLYKSLKLIFLMTVKFFAYFLMFSPAYVIAYSIRTSFDTDSFWFLILLGVVSNGFLVIYSQKFYTFLVTESRKGYVETAIVKNLQNRYSPKEISLRRILYPIKHFPGHVFEHIYKNARYQYLNTFKEQAGFLVTGLIIIEMALNIHGHLSYELLQQLLYENYQAVLLILYGIFFTVKGTEIIVDGFLELANRKIENRWS